MNYRLFLISALWENEVAFLGLVRRSCVIKDFARAQHEESCDDQNDGQEYGSPVTQRALPSAFPAWAKLTDLARPRLCREYYQRYWTCQDKLARLRNARSDSQQAITGAAGLMAKKKGASAVIPKRPLVHCARLKAAATDSTAETTFSTCRPCRRRQGRRRRELRLLPLVP